MQPHYIQICSLYRTLEHSYTSSKQEQFPRAALKKSMNCRIIQNLMLLIQDQWDKEKDLKMPQSKGQCPVLEGQQIASSQIQIIRIQIIHQKGDNIFKILTNNENRILCNPVFAFSQNISNTADCYTEYKLCKFRSHRIYKKLM